MLELKEVENLRLYRQVADQITELLRKGRWSLGERLPAERELAKQLGVSRPTVREAVIALELVGLVEVRTGAGIYIKALPDAVDSGLVTGNDQGPSPFDLIEARIVIEGEIAGIAAASISSEELENLLLAIEKMESDIEQGNQHVSSREDGDFLFHSRIAAITKNSVLQSIVEQLWAGMRRPLFRAICERVSLPQNARRAVKDHRVILEAIAVGNSEAAKAAMRRHLEQVRGVLMQYSGE